MNNEEKRYQQHLNSLEASEKFSRGVKRYMREKRINDYEQAAREYREELEDEGSQLHHVAMFGEAQADTDEELIFTRQEADELLIKATKGRMEKTGEDYLTARKAVESDPVMLEVVKSYCLG